jgi:hypothetical protein
VNCSSYSKQVWQCYGASPKFSKNYYLGQQKHGSRLVLVLVLVLVLPVAVAVAVAVAVIVLLR